jgi:outer membrane protein assembly factor BamB
MIQLTRWAIGLGALLWVAHLGGANWPGFRGGDLAGVAESEQPPVQFGPASNLVWKIATPKGNSSPIIWNDRIFLTGAEGNKLITVCLDRLTGQKRWEQSVTVDALEPVHHVNTSASPTPVTDGRAVYAYFGSLGVLAYDWEGKELWRKPLPMPKTSFNQGTSTSPILAEDKLLLFQQKGRDSYLLALDPKDGREIWRAPMPIHNNSYATPVYWREGGQGRVGMVCARRFTAFQLLDGKEAWWLNGIGIQVCATPVIAGDRLVLSTAGVQGDAANITVPPSFADALKQFDQDGNGVLTLAEIPKTLLYTDRHTSREAGNMTVRQALSMFGGVNKGDSIDSNRWESIRNSLRTFAAGEMNKTLVISARIGGSGEVPPSQIVWQDTHGVPEVPSPLIYRDRVYLIRNGGVLVCRDAETGKCLYESKTEARGGYFASPLGASGRLYLASDRGTITVVKAGDTFEVLAHNELEDPILASPALADNQLYVRSASQLWAFGSKPL